MLELLLDGNISVEELVRKHFFNCDKRAIGHSLGPEHYIVGDEGQTLCNSKYNVIFPHDEDNIENVNKYIRRFERLKDVILNAEQKICFLYVSPSSPGNYSINGEQVICDTFLYLSKIYDLIGKYNNNYKMLVFDAVKEEPRERLNENIYLHHLNSCDIWYNLICTIPLYLLED